MDKRSAPKTSEQGDFNRQNQSLLLLVIDIGIQGLRTLGLITLILIALFLLRLVIANPSEMYNREVDALRTIQTGFQTQTPSSPGSVNVAPPAAGAETGSGSVGKASSALSGVEVGVAGIATVSVPPVAWLILCIIASIVLVVWIEKLIRYVISQWRAVSVCAWLSSPLSFLGCLWTTIWAVFATVFVVFLILLLIVCVLSNIAALVAMF